LTGSSYTLLSLDRATPSRLRPRMPAHCSCGHL